ncbi:MAG: sulfate adenylyltransferase [Alteromonadaceae bacterium]|nr:sulfate adenylyltransferase [Alteromonadaceae bacterium]
MKLFRVFFCLLILPVHAHAFIIPDDLLKQVAATHGPDALQRLTDWQSLSVALHGLSQPDQLETVNRFFNQIPFLSDLEHWGTEDYWATPVEALSTFGADCEDYSIGKYLTLRSAGVPEDKLRITYVKALELNQAHMVVAFYPTPESDPLILDNLINDIKPASQRLDLKPVYSFNGEGLWLTKLQRQDERHIGTPERLDRWVELNRRLIEGLK